MQLPALVQALNDCVAHRFLKLVIENHNTMEGLRVEIVQNIQKPFYILVRLPNDNGVRLAHHE